MKLLYSFLCFGCMLIVFSQSGDWKNPNFHSLKVENQSVVSLNNPLIIVKTLTIYSENGEKLSTENYTYHVENQSIEFSTPSHYTIEYYTYPASLNQIRMAQDTALIVKKSDEPVYYEFSKGMKSNSTSLFDKLQTQGSLVRGLSFGNNQGASVQSSLDLKLEGKLNDELEIKGHLADYNVPIEQEGYTQQINEFEDIFLQIKNKKFGLSAGFLNVEQSQSYFANFLKKNTGVQADAHWKKNERSTDISLAGSVSRGEFNRIILNGVEGNQGPYRLTGKNKEKFIVIIPNSEHVYVNGILLNRGIDQDYTLNYNTGELTFTSGFLINSTHRITIDYQYTALYYNRFLVYGTVKHSTEKFQILASIYSESDSKNNPTDQNLSDQDKIILSEAGNNSQLMVNTSAVETEFDSNKILYRKIIVGNEEVFEYSTDPTEILYQISFNKVGPYQGNYKKSTNDLNGQVYVYVSPISGVPQGEYSPTQQLVAPESKQVYALDTYYNMKNGGLELNAAVSSYDQNTFSALDDTENLGYAYHGKLFKNLIFNEWKFVPSVEYSFIQKNFYIIDRIQKIEFYRDFNLNKEFNRLNQNQISLQALSQYKKLDFRYRFDFLEQKGLYNGNTQYINVQFQPEKTRAKADILLHSDSQSEGNNSLQDIDVSVSRNIRKNWATAGFRSRYSRISPSQPQFKNTQKNQDFYIKNVFNDSLQFSYETQIYLSNNDTLRYNNNLHSVSKGFIFNSKWNKGIDVSLHYRNTDGNNLQENWVEKNLLSTLHLYHSFLKNALGFDAVYTLGNGNEPQREFQYVRVADGNGIYKFTDYNGNGIEEIDEFEIAEFQDLANYVRVYTQTVSYIKTAKNGLVVSLLLNPYQYFSTPFSKRWKGRLNYTNQSSFLKENRVTEFNPFTDSQLMYRSNSFVGFLQFNTLELNRFEFFYKYTQLNNFRNNYLGLESLDRYTNQINIKYSFHRNFYLENDTTFERIQSYSENLPTKNYQIQSFSISPSLHYHYLKVWDIKTFYNYSNKHNILGIERLNINELGFDAQYLKNKTSLLMRLSFIHNRLQSENTSLITNQMMEGLKTGKNWVWGITLQNELTKFLYLNMQYEGRKSEENRSIHIGNVQLKLVF